MDEDSLDSSSWEQRHDLSIRETPHLPDGVDFADVVCSVTEQFSRGYGFLVDQQADRKNFFIIARGSIQECLPLLKLARPRKLIDEPKHAGE